MGRRLFWTRDMVVLYTVARVVIPWEDMAIVSRSSTVLAKMCAKAGLGHNCSGGVGESNPGLGIFLNAEKSGKSFLALN